MYCVGVGLCVGVTWCVCRYCKALRAVDCFEALAVN